MPQWGNCKEQLLARGSRNCANLQMWFNRVPYFSPGCTPFPSLFVHFSRLISCDLIDHFVKTWANDQLKRPLEYNGPALRSTQCVKLYGCTVGASASREAHHRDWPLASNKSAPAHLSFSPTSLSPSFFLSHTHTLSRAFLLRCRKLILCLLLGQFAQACMFPW